MLKDLDIITFESWERSIHEGKVLTTWSTKGRDERRFNLNKANPVS